MITTETLKKIFNEKLDKTGSMDQAFTKAVWVAYNAGLADGRAEHKPNPTTEEEK